MIVAVAYNADQGALARDAGGEARQDVLRVASAVAEALERRGCSVLPAPVGADPLGDFERLRRHRPDVVFNLCESLSGDARGEMAASGVLELLQLPYTGSPPLALGLALHKDVAKDVLVARGVPTPRHVVVTDPGELARVALPFPLIVKPAREDASVGIGFGSVVRDPAALAAAVRAILRDHAQPALVERYVDGREVYVPLLGNAPRVVLPTTEIRFGPAFDGRPRIVSYRAKWDVAAPEYLDSPAVPCTLPPPIAARAAEVAQAAFAALGCRDYGRVDLRLTPEGEPHVIDVNPNCDLHPEAGFARAAALAGMSYPDLVGTLVGLALERSHARPTHGGDRPARGGEPAHAHPELRARRGELRARGGGPGDEAG